jgi:hypothetical protein
MKCLRSKLECKILIKLFVLNCVIICCVHGDAIRADVVFCVHGDTIRADVVFCVCWSPVLKFGILCLYIVLKFYVMSFKEYLPEDGQNRWPKQVRRYVIHTI